MIRPTVLLGMLLPAMAAEMTIQPVGNGTWPLLPSGPGWDVQVEGRYAYVTIQGGGLGVLDISDPGTIVPVGTYGRGFAGLYRRHRGGLHVLDISDRTQIVRVSGYDTDGDAYRLHVVGHYAYVADAVAGVQILDVSDPAHVTRNPQSA